MQFCFDHVQVNMWTPVQRPAYRNPLCLLDSSTVDHNTETLRWKLDNEFDNGYNYQIENGGKQKHGTAWRPLRYSSWI